MTSRSCKPVSDRIYSLSLVEANTGCWLWAGAAGTSGYGTMTVKGRTAMAHRASYEAFKGPIPEGLHIDHKCKVRLCVNPDHLEPVTPAENSRRSPRLKPGPENCIHGHPLSGSNLYVKQGQRHCRECRRRNALARYYRLKGEVK